MPYLWRTVSLPETARGEAAPAYTMIQRRRLPSTSGFTSAIEHALRLGIEIGVNGNEIALREQRFQIDFLRAEFGLGRLALVDAGGEHVHAPAETTAFGEIHYDHAKNNFISVVRRSGGRGGEFLCLCLQEFEGQRNQSLHRGRADR